MTKFEEELMATAKMIPTLDGNEIKFKTSSALYDYLLSNGEAELYLQQQALPVVPECVAEWIEILKSKGLKPLKNPETYVETGFTEEKLQNILFWISENQEDYMRAWLDGYTVEKPQLFYLKHIDMSKADKEFDHYLFRIEVGRLAHHIVNKNNLPHNYRSVTFTQSEIDSMQTGSYEKIEVTE